MQRYYSQTLRWRIIDQQWERLRQYAGLVRAFTSIAGDGLDRMAVYMLLGRVRGEPLLPRLKHLTWVHDLHHSDALALFLSPMLRSIQLDMLEVLEDQSTPMPHSDHSFNTPTSECAYNPTLRLLLSRAPNLKHIDIQGPSTLSGPTHPLLSFNYLSSLRLGSISDLYAVLATCEALPGLKGLSVHLLQHSLDLDRQPNTETSLLALERLNLAGPSGLILAATNSINAPRLLHIAVSFEPDEGRWKAWTELVVSHFGATLGGIEAIINEPEEDLAPYATFEPFSFHAWFHPLYSLHELRRVYITSPLEVEFALVEKDAQDMAAAWPKVQILRVPTVQVGLSQLLPITALRHFATACFELEELTFPLPHHVPLVHLDLVSPWVHRNYTRSVCLPHQRADIQGWPSGARNRCLVYLRGLFPHAEIVLFNDGLND